MTTTRMSKDMSRRINQTTKWLYEHPWSTRDEIATALGFDITQMKRVMEYLKLRSRVRPPNLFKPLEYALPEAPPNPFRSNQ